MGTPPRRLAILLFCLAAGAGAEDEPDPDALIASAVPARREEGAALLAKQGDTTAAKKLIRLLDDADWGVRMAAIRGLGPIRFGPGRDALVEQATKGETRGMRVLAATMLQEHDAKDSAARLARVVTRYKKEARLPFLEALGIIGTDEGVTAPEKQMRAPEPEHRAAAAAALAVLRAGTDGLIHGLKDRESEVAIRSAVGLAGIDSDAARDALLDYLAGSRDTPESYVLRRAGLRGAEANRDALAAAIAARLPKARKPEVLLEIAWHGRLAGCAEVARAQLGARDPLARAFAFEVAALGTTPLAWDDVRKALDGKDLRVRYAAATAYVASAGREPDDALRHLLDHKNGDVAMVGVRAAAEQRRAALLPDLVRVARGETAAKRDWQLRTAACVAAGRVGFRAAYEPLVELTGARDWWLRAAAFEGLYHTYEKGTIPLLIAAFDDRHPVVRMTVRRNLRYMTRKHYVKKDLYQSWWEKMGPTLTLAPPDEEVAAAKKHGYATPQNIQDILRGTDIVAVLGRWDKVQLILEDLKVEHQAVRAQQIKDYGLSPKQIVLINCEGSVDSTVTQYLQWFVVAGGYMATTDWSLVNALDKTFPSVVKGYVKQSTGNDVVVVEAASPGHPTLEGVFRDNVELMWWLEIQAFPIAIEDPIRSTVLVDSLQMLLRYGSSAMMIEFPAGLGKVMHSTSHFYLQKEGFAHASDVAARKIFAADHLGLSVEEIRDLEGKGAFANVNNTTPISRSYSMFHLLVNFIDEKRRIDLSR